MSAEAVAAPVLEQLREEWDALGLMSYHGAPWDRGATTYYADLVQADIEKIRALLREAATAIETADKRLRHSEFHRTANRRRMRRLGKYQGVLEAKIVRQRQAFVDLAGELRREWWINHGHDGLYGDDGEMRCGRCLCDFKRDPIERVRKVVRAARLAAARVVTGVEPDGTIPMFCSACGKRKPNDAAWARPVLACECGNLVWTATVTIRG